MPELPEVETIRRQMQRLVRGKTISSVSVVDPRVVREPSAEQFSRSLAGARIEGVRRRAKLLILSLSGDRFLTIHLKMTGQLLYPGNGSRACVIVRFSDGSQLDFNDQRRFAELRLLSDWKDLAFVRRLGPEPQELSLPQFAELLGRSKRAIKQVLLDQSRIAGIGNLYAAEALFRARINPQRPSRSLKPAEQGALLRALRTVTQEAIRHGGSSIDNYVQLDGARGGYNRFHRVYAREKKPCRQCATPIRRITQSGRSTYYCPRCQT